jgi:RNA polymerase sigma factor (sigma-70 family)
MDLEDIVSYGNIGLMKAVDHYNPNNKEGATFATYASYYIKEEIRTAMEKNMIVYHGSFERMKNKEYSEISFDKPFEGDSERSMYDVFGGVVNTFSMNEEQECISIIFSEMRNVLKEMEYKVLIDIFINRKSMDEIGEENGMTKQNVSLIRISALKKMREFANSLFS